MTRPTKREEEVKYDTWRTFVQLEVNLGSYKAFVMVSGAVVRPTSPSS